MLCGYHLDLELSKSSIQLIDKLKSAVDGVMPCLTVLG